MQWFSILGFYVINQIENREILVNCLLFINTGLLLASICLYILCLEVKLNITNIQ